MRILLKVEEGVQLPQYETEGASGLDVRAYLKDGAVTIQPGEYKMIPTGIKMDIPVGYEVQVRPRSGLAAKHGVTVLNSPGTIDSDYRGEVKVILINHGKEAFVVNSGERIAQFVISKVIQADFVLSDELSESERGEGGFGSTGK